MDRGRWSRIPVRQDRCLVYGPAVGRLYLLTDEEAVSPVLVRMLGLARLAHTESLADPVERIGLDRATMRDAPTQRTSKHLVLLYRLFHRSRHVVPLRWMLKAVAMLAGRGPALDVHTIGRRLHAVEQAAGFADCYPRALLTATLCIRSGLAGECLVGTLAPTRKMHAWCCVDGVLPYEPSPEHYMYQPLVALPFP
jgi:hypothetical protein